MAIFQVDLVASLIITVSEFFMGRMPFLSPYHAKALKIDGHFFTGDRMPSLLPIQQCQHNEG